MVLWFSLRLQKQFLSGCPVLFCLCCSLLLLKHWQSFYAILLISSEASTYFFLLYLVITADLQQLDDAYDQVGVIILPKAGRCRDSKEWMRGMMGLWRGQATAGEGLTGLGRYWNTSEKEEFGSSLSLASPNVHRWIQYELRDWLQSL